MTVPPKHSIRVKVGGEDLALRTELPPEYAREVAEYYDNVLRQIRAASPALEAYKAAIMAGLTVSDELFRSRRVDADVGDRIVAMTQQVARMVPPAKRTGKNTNGE